MNATPGPWKVNEPPDSLAVLAGDREIATVESDTDDMPAEEGEANAALIAAAPELYEALRDAYELFTSISKIEHLSNKEHSRVIDKMSAALLKVEQPT